MVLLEVIHSSSYSDVDENGIIRMTMCCVIMANVEVVYPGSKQFQPTDETFDCGVDDLQKPKHYIIWDANVHSHIYAEYAVIINAPSVTNGITKAAGDLQVASLADNLGDLLAAGYSEADAFHSICLLDASRRAAGLASEMAAFLRLHPEFLLLYSLPRFVPAVLGSGRFFAQSIFRRHRQPVHPLSREAAFLLVVSFGRADFRLEERSVGCALEAVLGYMLSGCLNRRRIGRWFFAPSAVLRMRSKPWPSVTNSVLKKKRSSRRQERLKFADCIAYEACLGYPVAASPDHLVIGGFEFALSSRRISSPAPPLPLSFGQPCSPLGLTCRPLL